MKAEVTMSQIWFNNSLSDFFFRDQAYNTLEELVTRSTMSGQDTLDALDDATEDMDIDDVEYEDADLEEDVLFGTNDNNDGETEQTDIL